MQNVQRRFAQASLVCFLNEESTHVEESHLVAVVPNGFHHRIRHAVRAATETKIPQFGEAATEANKALLVQPRAPGQTQIQ